MVNCTYASGANQTSSTLCSRSICRTCGYANLQDANYCDHCASRLTDLMADLGVTSEAVSAKVRQSGGQIVRRFQRTSSNAILCMVAGVLGWSFLPIVGAVVAVIFGKRAIQEIREANGALRGKACVTIGMSLGIVELGLFVLGIVGSILVFVIPILVQVLVRSLASS